MIKYCATVIFHDCGYKSIKGISRLDRTCGTLIEDSYISGADNHPLCGQKECSRVGVVISTMALGDLKIAPVEQYLLKPGVSDRFGNPFVHWKWPK